MTSPASPALRIGAIGLLLLLALQIAWHGWLQPPAASRLLPTLVLAGLPLLYALWTCLSSMRRGVLIGGIVCLFYFSHAVAVAYGDPAARMPALLELALTLLIIGALGWDARGYKRKPHADG